MTTETEKDRAKSNFANLSPVKRAEMARKGGTTAHALGKAHRFTAEQARAASLKGLATRRANAEQRRLAKLQNAEVKS